MLLAICLLTQTLVFFLLLFDLVLQVGDLEGVLQNYEVLIIAGAGTACRNSTSVLSGPKSTRVITLVPAMARLPGDLV